MTDFVEHSQPALDDLVGGSTAKLDAFVLGSFVHGEKNKIIQLLTRDGWKISLYARNAVQSKKRFAQGLDLLSFSSFDLKVPREPLDQDPLWMLQAVDQKEAFLYMRKSYSLLDHAFLSLAFIRDQLPKGNVGQVYFVLLGKLFSFFENHPKEAAKVASQAFFLFWSCAFRLEGFACLGENFAKQEDLDLDEWKTIVLNQDFLALIELRDLPTFDNDSWRLVYQDWVSNTGRTWPFFEKKISYGAVR